MIIFAVLAGILGPVVLRRSPRKIGRIGIALAAPLVVPPPWWPSSNFQPLGGCSALDGLTPSLRRDAARPRGCSGSPRRCR